MTRSLGFLFALAACGGGARPAPEPAEPPSACVADPAIAATRRPKPAGTGCMSERDLTTLDAACAADDPDACFRRASCALLAQLGADPAPAAIATNRATLQVACAGGIAEACTARVAVAMSGDPALPADGCADLRRACHLGDEQGCFDCRNQDCR